MRRWLLALAVMGICVWWWRGDSSSRDGDDHELQAAVLADGFALFDGHRVIELDRKGQQRKQHGFAREDEVRVVGSPSGPLAGFIESKKVRLVRVASGQGGQVFGKSVRLMCDGAATNDERFAIAWLEADDVLWFVHGDTRTKRTDAQAVAAEPIAATTVARKNWCGVASALDQIALFWRDGNRLFIQTCTRKKCSGLPATVKFDSRDTLLGFGCVRDACLLASRDREGRARLQYVTESGSTKWMWNLPIDKLEVAVIGAGENAFAVGYSTDRATQVLRVERNRTITTVWTGPAAAHAPALAWSRDQLLVGHHGGGPALVGFPR